jgi:hypothetical protein
MNKPIAQLDLVPTAKVDEPDASSPTADAPDTKTNALTVLKCERDESADFDWCDDDAVAVREQRAIAIYLNPAGDIVIRQQTWRDEDPFVVISPDNLMLVIDRVCDIAGIPAAGGSGRS